MLIAVDSNVFIAALSPHEEHSAIAQHLIRDIAEGRHQAIASSIVYGEVLGVSKKGDIGLDIEDFITHITHLSIIPAGDAICLQAGELRRSLGSKLKLPDALHVATAISVKADVFVTNDVPLAKAAQTLVPVKPLAAWH